MKAIGDEAGENPPRDEAMISFLPPARPSTPVAVYLNVLPGEARQSIQAFNWLGIPKLYIGAPSTTMWAPGTPLPGGSPYFDDVAGQRSGLVQRLQLGEQHGGRLVRDGCYRQIAIGNFETRCGLLQACDDTRRKLPADRLTAGNAGIDV